MTISSNIIIINKKKEYLLQLRDCSQKILSPNYWCLFGGGVKVNESPKKCIYREVFEELDIKLNIPKLNFLTQIKYCRFNKKKLLNKHFFFYKVSDEEIKNLKLREGRAFKFIKFKDIFKIKILPWDFYGIVYNENKNSKSQPVYCI